MNYKTITDISQQKKRPTRVNIYLDEEFWCGMGKELASDLDLRRGRQLSQKEIDHCHMKVVEREALDYCLSRLTGRASSTGQLTNKLRERGHGDEVIEATMERLQELLLIDDDQYALDMVNQKINKGQWGIRISQALDKAGIDRTKGQEILAEVAAEKNEEEIARKTLLRRYPRLLDKPDSIKAQNFLARRGFSGQVCRLVVGERMMSLDDQALIYNEEAARKLLDRRGRKTDSRGDKQKAFAYLMRRGFSSEVIKKAIG